MNDATTDNPAELFSHDVVDALGRLLVVLADNKYRLGLRYAEWCNSAPTLEAAVAAAALTQDELGHARSLYPLLRHFPNPPAEFDEDENARAAFLNMACLEHPFQTWAEFVAANTIPDQMLYVVFEAAVDSAYRPLAQRAAKILQEEHYHVLYAQGWCAQFLAEPAASDQLQSGVAHLWPETVAWFGPPGDTDLELLHDAEVLNADGDTLRQRFVDRAERLLGDGMIQSANGIDDWNVWDGHARRLEN